MRFTALSPIEHDGVRYEPGAAIDLAPEAARSLAEIGALEEARGPVPAAPEQAPEERAARLNRAADLLDRILSGAEVPPDVFGALAAADGGPPLRGVTDEEVRTAIAVRALSESQAGDDPEGGSEAASGDPPERGDDPAAGSDPAAGDPDRHASIAAAIDRLIGGGREEWTALGLPRVEAIVEAGGPADLTAAERDRVWRDMSPSRP